MSREGKCQGSIRVRRLISEHVWIARQRWSLVNLRRRGIFNFVCKHDNYEGVLLQFSVELYVRVNGVDIKGPLKPSRYSGKEGSREERMLGFLGICPQIDDSWLMREEGNAIAIVQKSIHSQANRIGEIQVL